MAPMAMPAQRLVPGLFYDEPSEALHWLDRVLGFETALKITDDIGTIQHAEVEFEGIRVMIAGTQTGAVGFKARPPADQDGWMTQALHLYVADVDAHYTRAKAEGAHIVAEPEDQFYGDRRYRQSDCGGHLWSIYQKLRDVPVEEMRETTGLTIETGEAAS